MRLYVLTFFADFVADNGTCRRTADCAQRAAEYGIAGNTTQNRAHTGADLCVGGAGAATDHGRKCKYAGC